MKKIDLRDQMIHVERIVRPVRASERRKMAMRSELLAHLQAALDEERERQSDEAAAWENAKRRLGVPGELTRALQASVPALQRLLLSRVPATSWLNPWERNTGRLIGMTRLALSQQAVVMLGAMFLTYGTAIILALRINALYSAQLIQGMTEHTWQFQAGCGLTAILMVLFLGAAFSVMGAAANGLSRSCIARRGYFLVGCILEWQAIHMGLAAQQPILISELARGAGMGVLVVVGLVALGRKARHMSKWYREWLDLEIAE